MPSKSPFVPPAKAAVRQVEVLTGYRAWAPTYDDMLTDTVDGPILRRFIPLLPVIDGSSLIEIGCGTGRTVQWLREQAITVDAVGIDICPEMLEQARAKQLYRRLIAASRPELDERFKLGFSVLVSCHIEDLPCHYSYLYEHLEREAHLILIDMHPHMFHVGKGTYVPIDSEQLYITNYLHEISDHVHAAQAAGFQLVSVEESFVPETWAAQSPDYGDLTDHPLGIGFLWRKAN